MEREEIGGSPNPCGHPGKRLAMAYQGHVAGGVIVLDGDVSLPDGTVVRVEPIVVANPNVAQKFQNVIGQATSLPADMAEQHDHYLHGSPKR
jgi:hypothetical protein